MIAPDYVCRGVETLQRTNAGNVGGKLNSIDSNAFGKAVALVTSTASGKFQAVLYKPSQEQKDRASTGFYDRKLHVS